MNRLIVVITDGERAKMNISYVRTNIPHVVSATFILQHKPSSKAFTF